MRQDDFQTILDQRIKLIQKVLAKKADEYASDDDRLHNFKLGAKALREQPESYCMQLMMKHIVSILDLVRIIEERDACANASVWDEKIGDAINYLILLEALVSERLDGTVDRALQNLSYHE